MSAFVANVSDADFQQAVIERSFQTPVLVDFWATWCGPCKVLKPLLEKLAEEYQGKFFLAMAETGANQQQAANYGIRGVPAVKAFINGESVDEFTGALPEGEIRAFLERLIPSPGEALRLEAETLYRQGDPAGALQRLAEASALDPNTKQPPAKAGGFELRTESPDTRRLNDASHVGWVSGLIRVTQQTQTSKPVLDVQVCWVTAQKPRLTQPTWDLMANFRSCLNCYKASIQLKLTG